MRYANKALLGGTLAAVLLIHLPAGAQAPTSAESKAANLFTSPAGEEPGSALDCQRPEGTREAKVIDFDASSSTARLAVSLEAGRFTLVTIKTWDRPDDPRPLNPVIQAAKIMQGKLQFFSRKLTTDPASTPDEFLILTEMGGGYVCWAKPSWMIQPSVPVAEALPAKPAAPTALVTPAAAVGGSAVSAPASAAVTRARRAIDAAREAVTQ
jgi:hypothetical protein